MIRVMATDVVSAYKQTGLIPIRKAWQSEDTRGGCAIDALARSLGEGFGEAWATRLDPQYLQGFLAAWDEDEPITDPEATVESRQGHWDAILCREAVERAFSSVASIENTKNAD